MKNPWFKAKHYGYGWYPATWQGWLILALFLFSVLGNFYRLGLANNPGNENLYSFFAQTILMVLALLLICFYTGEKPHWRWGGKMLLVYTTFPDRKVAGHICSKLVEEKLIACANINQIESHYIWEGEILESNEVTAFLKTTCWNFTELKKRLIELHPYERPSVIKIKAEANQDYFNWLTEMVKK